MNVAVFIKVVFFILLAGFIAGAATLIYLPIYKRNINNRLRSFGADDQKEKKPLIPPSDFFFIVCGIVLAVYLGASALLMGSRKELIGLGQVEEPYVWVREICIPSLIDGHEPGEELPGYRLTSSKNENGFEICFYSGCYGDFAGFPDGMICVKNTGSEQKFRVAISGEQKNAVFPDYVVDYGSDVIEKQIWYTADMFNYFGTLDITVMPEDSNDTIAKLHISIEKDFEITP